MRMIRRIIETINNSVTNFLNNINVWTTTKFICIMFLFFIDFVFFILPRTRIKNLLLDLKLQVLLNELLNPIVFHTILLTTKIAIIASLINVILGTVVVWILIKYKFFGKTFLQLILSIPFQMPSLIIGLIFLHIYNKETILASLLVKFKITIIFTRLGLILTLIFVSFPIIVENLKPSLEKLNSEIQQAVWSSRYSRIEAVQKIFYSDLLKILIKTFWDSFARTSTEYSAIILIVLHLPKQDLINPTLIIQFFDQFRYKSAVFLMVFSVQKYLQLSWQTKDFFLEKKSFIWIFILFFLSVLIYF